MDFMRANALAARDALAKYAQQNNWIFIDPSDSMITAILQGTDPFMVYDSHWNTLGHTLVAEAVAQQLEVGERQ